MANHDTVLLPPTGRPTVCASDVNGLEALVRPADGLAERCNVLDAKLHGFLCVEREQMVY